MSKAGMRAARLFWFILRTTAAIALIVALMAFSFYTAMELSNIYIITTDGMQKRASAVLNQDVQDELIEYFTPAFLEKDELLNTDRYRDFTIRSFAYKIKVEWMWTLPWKDTGTATVLERVPTIDAEMPKDKLPEGYKGEMPVPKWEDYRYEVKLLRNADGRWYITDLEKLEKAPPMNYVLPGETTPSPIESPDVTPAGSPTQTPIGAQQTPQPSP